MARLVVASLLIGAAVGQGFPVPPPPVAKRCLPAAWSGGYTRTSDTAAAVGNVSHNYATQVFAVEEAAFGFGPSGGFQNYKLHYYQLVNQSYAGITWSDGTSNCYKSDSADTEVNKRCFKHASPDRIALNGRPAKSWWNTFKMKNGSEVNIEAMLVQAQGNNHFPVQSFSWTFNSTKRDPSFVFVHNPLAFNNPSIARIPNACQKVEGETGPHAEAILRRFAKRAQLLSEGEEGPFVHPQAPKASKIAPTESMMMASAQGAEAIPKRACVPNAYWSEFYYMTDNFTVSGQVTHNFAKKEWAVSESISGPILHGKELYVRFVQKGKQAWSITLAKNGTVVDCATSPVREQYDQRCQGPLGAHNPIQINGAAGFENHLYNPTGTKGNGPTYIGFYQGANQMPVGVLNFTNARNQMNGNPTVLSFYNNKFGINQKLMKVPASCSTGAAAEAKVLAQADKWANHLLTAAFPKSE